MNKLSYIAFFSIFAIANSFGLITQDNKAGHVQQPFATNFLNDNIGTNIMRKIEYQPNQNINNLIFLKETKSKLSPGGHVARFGIFKCQCGEEFETSMHKVACGRTGTCQKCSNKRMLEGSITHGLSGHPLYVVWKSMRVRCSKESHEQYKNYGGRGIAVCGEWQYDFVPFYNWCTSKNWTKDLQIDRIDNDKGYSPDNCQLITQLENARKRPSTKLTLIKANEIRRKFKSNIVTHKMLAKEYGVSKHTIQQVLSNKTWN